MGIVEQYLSQLNTKKQRFRRQVALLAVLSLLVMLSVSWNLRQTGVAIANDACCGVEEHRHVEACILEKTLICGFDEETPTEEPTEKPTEEPTEEPTEKPTETPKETQPAEVTKTVTIELPADRTEDYVLGLFFNGKSVLEDTAITAGTRSIDVTLTGAGTVYYDLYINGECECEKKVTFN